MDLINPITFERSDYCHNCNNARSIECYDINNRSIFYSNLLDNLEKGLNIDHIRKGTHFSYMQCKKCKKIYSINWDIEKEIPKPLITNTMLNHFLNNYKK